MEQDYNTVTNCGPHRPTTDDESKTIKIIFRKFDDKIWK